MKTCKIYPNMDVCRECQDEPGSCSTCKYEQRFELLSFGYGPLVGNFGFVLIDGKIKRIPLDQIYDVREE